MLDKWSRGASLFHGFIAVAPLKHGESCRTRLQSALFHVFIDVAPLKPREDRVVTVPKLPISSTSSLTWPH